MYISKKLYKHPKWRVIDLLIYPQIPCPCQMPIPSYNRNQNNKKCNAKTFMQVNFPMMQNSNHAVVLICVCWQPFFSLSKGIHAI